MFIQYPVQVNAIEYDRSAQARRGQIRPEVQIERPTLHAEVGHCFLAIESPLGHRL
jgi:hypothetical protein